MDVYVVGGSAEVPAPARPVRARAAPRAPYLYSLGIVGPGDPR